MRHALILVGLTSALSACAGSRDHADRPAGGSPLAERPRPVVEHPVSDANASAPTVTKAKFDYTYFAKDGKCGDRLAKAYEESERARRASEKQLVRNIQGYEAAKRQELPMLERWLDPIKAEYARLVERVRPFNETYAKDFACARRSDDKVLSREALDANFVALSKYVNGVTGRVSAVPQEMKLKE